MGFKVFPERVEILSKDLNDISGMILKDIYDGVFALGICKKHAYGVFNDSFKITRKDFFEVEIKAGAGFHSHVSTEEQPFPINLPMYMSIDVDFPLNSAGAQPRYDLIMARNVISEDPYEERNFLDDSGDKQTDDLLVSKSFGVEFSIETGAEDDNPQKPPVPNGWTPLAYVIVTPGIGVTDDDSVIDARYIFDDYISGQDLRDVEDKVDQNTQDIEQNAQDIDYIKNNPPEIPSGGLEPRELVITKLELDDLKANSMYLVYPDKNEPANNVLTLPRGIEGDVILIQDPEWDFQDFPVKITCRSKIDGYDSIILDVPHGWLEFTWSEINKTWKTRDSYGTVEVPDDGPDEPIEIPDNIVTSDNLDDNLRESELFRDHEKRITKEELQERLDKKVLENHTNRIKDLEENNSITVLEKTIDSLDETPLEVNTTYLITPDELNPENNELILPQGEEGAFISIQDCKYKFKDYPVRIVSSEKIDNYDSITMDMEHCYLDFFYSAEESTWFTKDPLYAPVPDLPENNVTADNLDDNLKESELFRNHEKRIIKEELREQVDKKILQDHQDRLKALEAAEGAAQIVRDIAIDSLQTTPLIPNSIYLVVPDAIQPQNNILKLPQGTPSAVVTIVDANWRFKKHPVVIEGSDGQTIDEFEQLELNLNHCWMDFIWSESQGEWKTKDAAHIPMYSPDDDLPNVNGSRKIEEKIIDSLDLTPLSMNTLYLIKPDENFTDNNMLALPRGVESGTISILDYMNNFSDNPVVISSAQKIDGFNTITLDLDHCYIDFIFNDEKGTWHTNDYIFRKKNTKRRSK